MSSQTPSRESIIGWRDVALRSLRRLAETSVSLDPRERAAVIEAARQELIPAAGSQFLREQLEAADRAANGLATHNEKTQQAIDKVAHELAGIFRAVARLSEPGDAGEAESFDAFRRVLDESDGEESLAAVRDRLIAATEVLRGRLEEKRRQQDALIGDLKKRVDVLEAIVEVPVVQLEPVPVPPPPPGASGMDGCTGLQNRGAAETAIWQAGESPELAARTYVAIFCLPKVGFYRTKYGQPTADLIVLAVSQQLGEAVPQPADLFRWSETTFVAILQRGGGMEAVQKEIGQYVAHSAGWYFEDHPKKLLVVTKVAGKALGVAARNYQDICAEIDAFVAGNPA